MNITLIDKSRSLLKVYSIIWKMPSMKQILLNLINPVDTVRYTEFTYLLKFIEMNGLKQMTVLDISSPFMMAYILASQNKVIKTDVNLEEYKNINGNVGLSFMLEDATQLSFNDNTFDLVYSISVIEHIYKNYNDAINEMIRVVKTDGYIYLTFPVSVNYVEEWIQNKIYSHQYEKNNKTFFQYRFGEEDTYNILAQLYGTEVMDISIYWERKNGQYDKTMEQIKKQLKNKYLNFLKNSFVNFVGGFTLLENKPSNFKDPRLFGNVSIILRKKSDTGGI